MSYGSSPSTNRSTPSSRGRVQAEKPRYAEKSTPQLTRLAKELNQENTFYNVLKKSTYTDDEISKTRQATKAACLKEDTKDNKSRFNVHVPLDAAAAPERSETALSNSWPLMGNGITDMKVHGWTITFIPDIPPQRPQARRQALRGGPWRERTSKNKHLRNWFGEFEFDNQMIWSQKCDVALDENQSCYIQPGQFGGHPKIKFTKVGLFPIDEIPEQEAERLCNLVFVRPAMDKLGFYWRDRTWFSKNPKVTTINEFKDEAPLEVIVGYQLNIKMTRESKKNTETGEITTSLRPTLKVQRKVRLEHGETVLDMLERGKRICAQKGLDFETYAETPGRIVGRKGYVTYANRQGVVIDRLNWGNNEKGMISDLNKTIGQYLAEKYVIPFSSIRPQMCTIQKANDDANFLPQFVKLSAQSDDSPMNYGAALLHTSGTPKMRHEECQDLVNKLAPMFEKFKWNLYLAPKAVQVDLHPIMNPMMHTKAKGRNDGTLTSFSPTELPGCWGRNMGGPIEGGDLDDEKSTWAVICQPEHKQAAEACCKFIDDYRGMRKLQNKIVAPKLRILMLSGNMNDIEAYNKVVEPTDSVLFAIIPEGMIGSQMKVYFTKAVHYLGQHTNPPNLQFILAPNAARKNPVLSAAANVLLKNNNVLYKLSAKGTSTLDGAWMIGLATSHNGEHKPSVACLTVFPEPLVGTSRSWRVHATIQQPRQEIMSGRNAEALLRNILMDLHQTLVMRQKKHSIPVIDQLPKVLIIIRDGLADDQLVESVEEELLGLQSAVSKYSSAYALGWNPKFMILVSNKKGMDDFAVCRNGEIVGKGAPNSPVVMLQRDVLSSSMMDFLMVTNPNNQTSKPKRLIVLRDDMELCRSKHGVTMLATYLQATSWAFAYSLPFSSGNTAQSACVHVAKHYAENVSQMLTQQDQDVAWGRSGLKTRPQLCGTPTPSAVGQGIE